MKTTEITELQSLGADSALAHVIRAYLYGTSSPEVALMQMLCESENAEAVRRAIRTVEASDIMSGRDGEALRQRLSTLALLADRHEAGCVNIARMIATGPDSSLPARTVDEGLAFSERLFDWSVNQSEEASVALYSLGDPGILDRATAEIVDLFSSWGGGLLGEERVILQIGCGIGRMEAALASRVQEAYAVDVSGEMIARARRRCAAYSNVYLAKTDGRDLSMFADEVFDFVYAVDTFPYLVQAGPELVDTHFRDAKRVLKPGGSFAILNYAYAGNLAEHREEVRRYADRYGFKIAVGGEQPFQLWNGAVWRLIV